MDLIPEGLQNGLNFPQRVSNIIVANFQEGLKQGWRIAQDVLPETKINFFINSSSKIYRHNKLAFFCNTQSHELLPHPKYLFCMLRLV